MTTYSRVWSFEYDTRYKSSPVELPIGTTILGAQWAGPDKPGVVEVHVMSNQEMASFNSSIREPKVKKTHSSVWLNVTRVGDVLPVGLAWCVNPVRIDSEHYLFSAHRFDKEPK